MFAWKSVSRGHSTEIVGLSLLEEEVYFTMW